MENSPSTNQEMQQEMTIGRWMFNPFIRIAGTRSLAIGLVGIVAAGLAAGGALAYASTGLLDAVHRVHGLLLPTTSVDAGNEVALWVPVEGGRAGELGRVHATAAVGRSALQSERRSAGRHRGHTGHGPDSPASGGRDLRASLDSRRISPHFSPRVGRIGSRNLLTYSYKIS